ncbi:peptidoglycan-binding domain-containing protein [Pleomorphomonas oryzae]|uniref:peptidoglycan-binding domain-containing protein n=1 Tax=Pleomorphomonas oryzae TaxID=261934 RepID=UPI00047DCD57|nr:peptidoglycan-binding domain-containing protein [Pleomorphomonas oryzae]
MAGRKTHTKTGLVALLFRGAIGNPMATVGGLMITATAVAIMTNALMLQPRAHPAPLFVGTRPIAPAAQVVAQPPVLRTTDGSTVGATDHSLISDIQQGLKDFGYYKGDVDGLDGPQTSQAILAFERAFRLTPTGAPSNNVLLAIRSVRPKTSLNGATPVAADPVTVGSLPSAASSAPVPRPKPNASVVQPVQAAPGDTDTAAVSSDGIADLIASTAPTNARPAPAASAPPTAPVASAAPAAPTVDNNLARIQRSLSQQGFGPVAVNGVMSTETRDAIKQFQAYYNLPQTGVIDQAFIAQLVKVGGL